MVFSKDAYSSGRCETATGCAEEQGGGGGGGKFEPAPIFTHFLSSVSQRERHLGRKNAQLFRRLLA